MSSVGITPDLNWRDLGVMHMAFSVLHW